MGIRPSMFTVFGIDDLKVEGWTCIDSRLVKKSTLPFATLMDSKLLEPLPRFLTYRSDLRNGLFSDFLYWEPEYGVPNVMGLIVSDNKVYDHDSLRALSMIDPKYEKSDYSVIPPLDDWAIKAKEEKLYKNILPQHFYDQGYYSDVPMWIEAASYLFNHIGLEIKPEEMKWMLVWDWS